MGRKKDRYGIELFEALVEELSNNWVRFAKPVSFDSKGKPSDWEFFEYPDYCGIAKIIRNTLSSDAVDLIQEVQGHLHAGLYKTKKQVFNALLGYFFVLSDG